MPPLYPDQYHSRSISSWSETVASILTTRSACSSTLFPYTTLFRSPDLRRETCRGVRAAGHPDGGDGAVDHRPDRKSTRLNSSHVKISYAGFCMKKKQAADKQPYKHRKWDG